MMKTGKKRRAAALIFSFILASALVPHARGRERALPPPALKPGTYLADVKQTTTAISDGTTVTDKLKMRLRIVSVDEKNNVKAYVVIHNHKGDVSGSVDSEGNLRLEGVLTHTVLPGEWQFELTAVVKGDALRNGEYVKTSSRLKSKGEFKVAVLEGNN